MIARLLRVTGLVALAAAFLLTCAMAVGLVFGWWRVLPVQSGSMDPTIPKGAAVIVTPESFTEIQVGQIIVYDPPTPGNSLLVHRVVAVDRTGDIVRVRTRGDANTADDPWTAELANPPVWKVQKVVPHAGSLVDLLRNRALRLALFPVALLGLAIAVLATLAQMPSVAAQVAAAARRDDDPTSPTPGATHAPSIDLDGPAVSTPDPTDAAAAPGARRAGGRGRGLPQPTRGASLEPVPMMTAVTAQMLHQPALSIVSLDEPAAEAAPVVVATAPVVAEPVVAEPLVAAPVAPVVVPEVAADWYRDPTGRFELRWFDGTAWTAHVAVGGERRTDPLR